MRFSQQPPCGRLWLIFIVGRNMTMKPRTRKLLIMLAVVVAAVVGFFSVFTVTEMGSTSMEPVVSGRGSPPSHAGDIVVATRIFRAASLRPGQLVIVDIPTERGSVRTVREIQQVTSDGRFQVAAAAAQGIDSRHFGPLAAEAVRARVLWVIPSGS